MVSALRVPEWLLPPVITRDMKVCTLEKHPVEQPLQSSAHPMHMPQAQHGWWQPGRRPVCPIHQQLFMAAVPSTAAYVGDVLASLNAISSLCARALGPTSTPNAESSYA